jgi:hypothetical protein
MVGACILAALDDAEARVLEEECCHIAVSVSGVEVMQRAETKAQSVHESHPARHDAVSA